MSDQTDYLGRKYVSDVENVERMRDAIGQIIAEQSVIDVMSTLQTFTSEILFQLSSTREEAHAGVDQIAGDIKKHLNYMFAEAGLRKDLAGHA